MKNTGFKKAKKIYMIGIKGVGMTPVAQILKKMGCRVSGSDIEEKFFTDAVLKREGIKYHENFSKDNIPKDTDLIIHSSAFTSLNNKEMKEAIRRGLPILTQAEALAQLFNSKIGVAVCGSHGKTTTAALLGFILKEAGLRPTVEVGSAVHQFKGNAFVGGGDLMIIEADEYQNKLKHYQPRAVVLNNIDYDHPDFFKNSSAYFKVFFDFAKKVPKTGFIVANMDDDKVVKVAERSECKVIGYGRFQKKAIFDIKYSMLEIKNEYQFFRVYHRNKKLGEFKMRLIGEHNVQNAVASLAAAMELGVDLQKIKRALALFKGTARRMEVLGKREGALFIDDYAHHPTEIKATLAAARKKYPAKKIICVFMPHTFTRTEALFHDFTKSFGAVDELILLPIYGSAREKSGKKKRITSVDLLKKILSNKFRPPAGASYQKSIKECASYLRKKVGKDDVVILMGAGDTFRIWDEIKDDKK